MKLPPNFSEGYTKFDEVPYDFIRKRLSVVVEKDGRHLMLTKGALENVLEVCEFAEYKNGQVRPLAEVREVILKQFELQSEQGFRTIGVAWKDLTDDPRHQQGRRARYDLPWLRLHV